MKLIGNIVCTIAILTQIVLSMGLLSHAPECQVGQPVTVADVSEKVHHHCGCGHHHSSPAEVVNADLCVSVPTTPPHDCTCSPQKTYPYVMSDQIVEQKSKQNALDAGAITSTEVSFSQLSLLLCKSNQSNAPPPQTDYLPQSDTRFTSIHLGVFLI